MNEPLSRETIDRLVEGELSPEARRATLQRLDERPEAWRDVALAFLEAQTFAQALSGRQDFRDAPSTPSKPTARDVVPNDRSRWFAAGVAAGWVVAFAAGWGLSHWATSAGDLAPAAAPGPVVVDRPAPRAESIDPGVARSELQPTLASFPVFDDAGEEWSQANRESREAFDRWRREVEQTGATVQVRHTLVGLQREDGARAVAPVDQVYVRPVSRVVY